MIKRTLKINDYIIFNPMERWCNTDAVAKILSIDNNDIKIEAYGPMGNNRYISEVFITDRAHLFEMKLKTAD